VHTMVFEADVIGRTAAWLARVPVVSSIIGEMYGPEQFALVPSRRRLKMAWLTDIATARLAIRFHAVTNALATVMVPRLRIDDRRVEVIYRGRDPAEFTPVTPARRHDIRHRLGIDDSMLLVIAVARHEPVKNLESLIRAAPQIIGTLPSCRVMIAGRTGESTALLERLIRNDGLEAHVMLLGERSDVADLLAAADALVCPSLREGIGGSVLEALASGCPIACSDLASLREVTVCAAAECDEPRFDAPHMHLARFFPPTDIEALAEQVIACLAEGRTELGDSRRRRHFERNFDADAVAAQMVEFYRRALGSPG
jgi:glycosyltransferase involved in cell wall biosynthesis